LTTYARRPHRYPTAFSCPDMAGRPSCFVHFGAICTLAAFCDEFWPRIPTVIDDIDRPAQVEGPPLAALLVTKGTFCSVISAATQCRRKKI